MGVELDFFSEKTFKTSTPMEIEGFECDIEIA